MLEVESSFCVVSFDDVVTVMLEYGVKLGEFLKSFILNEIVVAVLSNAPVTLNWSNVVPALVLLVNEQLIDALVKPLKAVQPTLVVDMIGNKFGGKKYGSSNNTIPDAGMEFAKLRVTFTRSYRSEIMNMKNVKFCNLPLRQRRQIQVRILLLKFL